MSFFRKHILPDVLLGLLLIGPLYISILLVAKVLVTLGSFLQPITAVLPFSVHFQLLVASLLMVLVCYLLGLLVKTTWGQIWRQKIESGLLERIPGYAVLRGFMRRVAGKEVDSSWQPALIRTDDDALMPAFVIEELEDGRYTVFVPSVPTPFAGAVFIYQRERVDLVNIPFNEAIKMISHWGQGAAAWVAATKIGVAATPDE